MGGMLGIERCENKAPEGARHRATGEGGCNKAFFNILLGLKGLLRGVIGTTDEWP